MAKVLKTLTETFLDYPTVNGSAVVVRFIGCAHNCKGCHNKELQNYGSLNEGTPDFYDFVTSLQAFCKRCHTNKVVLEGGDPLFPANRKFTQKLLQQPFDFCVYTGYSKKDIDLFGIKGFKFLKCGKYEEALAQKSEKTNTHFVLASSNQEIYDENLSLVSTKGVINFD